MNKKLTILMILDGFGNNDKEEGNAIKLARTPNLDRLMKIYPNTQIHTSGEEVGLPDGQMGNSEVGHINIGAGRIVYQEAMKITKSIETGDFFSIRELIGAIEHCKRNNSKLHIMGLVSNGGVHSNKRHLYALLELAKRKDFDNVYIHFFSDGRDTSPTSSEISCEELEQKIEEKGVGKIASVMGRYYSMDRDKRWDRVKKAYDALVYGIGEKANTVNNAIEKSYQKEIFDEFIEPTLICNNGKPIATISDKDAVIFFNFRHDRGRELTRAIVDKNFKEFDTKSLDLYYVCMTEYDSTIPNVEIAFKPDVITNTFGEYISSKGLTQLRIAETEKYAHVTFFFNGGVEEKQYKGEDRILVESPKVPTYDMQPEMNISEVTQSVIQSINSRKYDCIILNYANPDMVGHTGNIDAAIKAVESVDKAVGQVVEEIEKNNDVLLITSDHGNIEQMIDYSTGEVNTAHTTNLVPFILIGKENVKLKSGKLADIAPTILDIMGLPKPEEMTGESLIE